MGTRNESSAQAGVLSMTMASQSELGSRPELSTVGIGSRGSLIIRRGSSCCLRRAAKWPGSRVSCYFKAGGATLALKSCSRCSCIACVHARFRKLDELFGILHYRRLMLYLRMTKGYLQHSMYSNWSTILESPYYPSTTYSV